MFLLITISYILSLCSLLFSPGAATRQHPRQDAVQDSDDGPKEDVVGSRFLSVKTQPFVVNGSAIPEVDFDIGESYAGLLPISDAQDETRKLFFWFWPSLNQSGPQEIAIWFNGGPGCSSLIGALLENGPFLWRDGTAAPIRNAYDWRNLTNVMWVDQPIGTGYTQGKQQISSSEQSAKQFLEFYRHFAETFNVKGWKIYLTGESYAGVYLPYIANELIKTNDLNLPLAALHLNDPLIGSWSTQGAATVKPFADYWSNLLGINTTTLANLSLKHQDCGYKDLLDRHFTFPAPQETFPILAEFPPPEPGNDTIPNCDTLDYLGSAATRVNPCFNVYRISDHCPIPESVMRGNATNPNTTYFNRTDVKKALHVPVGTAWHFCADGPVFIDPKNSSNPDNVDESLPPAHNGVLQNVIEKTNRVVIGSGNLDALLNTNGTLLALQNTTWNGWQGFKEFPGKDFIVPCPEDMSLSSASGCGTVGKWGAERGLTFYQVQLAGHTVPGDALAASFRVMELLLGRSGGLD